MRQTVLRNPGAGSNLRPRFTLRLLGPLAGVWLALAVGTASAQSEAATAPKRPPTLQRFLGSLLEAAGLGDQVGVSVVDLRSGREVAAHRSALPLNPASNMKLVTSAAALVELGPDFRMLTGLYGRREADAVVGGLTLKGHGDPTLGRGDILALAQALYARGVRKIDEVMVDGSYFDDRVLPPAFEQQPNEFAAFRAAVAAVSVDANAYTIRIQPGKAVGEPAGVHLYGAGHFKLTNKLKTVAGGAPKVVAVQSSKDDKLALRLSGSVPIGVRGLSYRRRVESPLHRAGYMLVEALRAVRIQVPERVTVRQVPASTPLIVAQSSRPLSTILLALGKRSDNFTAEMVLKVLGAERGARPGTSAAGAKAALRTLKHLGVATANIRIVNGSGLFDGNAIAASHLTQMLRAVHDDPAIRSEFLAHLAVGGVDGTLAKRLTTLPSSTIVRAKTGTLASVASLSGYVLGPHGQGMAFSFMANGIRGRVGAARGVVDKLVTEIANRLQE